MCITEYNEKTLAALKKEYKEENCERAMLLAKK